MTQAFNLSQLANNVNVSGQLNASAGLYNSVPVANGGTGRASVTSGNLLVGAGTANMSLLAGSTPGQVVSWNGTAWTAAAASGGALQTYTVATTPGTWTKPATLKGVKVTVIGGGGTGGSAITPASGNQTSGAGGGGGGGASIILYPAPSLPGPQPYTVGGVAGTSSFGVAPAIVVTATGGTTASNATNSGTAGGAGGVGSNGNINIAGSGGNGGSSISPALNAQGGVGGSSILGGGGAGPAMIGPGGTANGVNGGNYGAGGSGGCVQRTNSPATAPGGTGASGVIIIEEFY